MCLKFHLSLVLSLKHTGLWRHLDFSEEPCALLSPYSTELKPRAQSPCAPVGGPRMEPTHPQGTSLESGLPHPQVWLRGKESPDPFHCLEVFSLVSLAAWTTGEMEMALQARHLLLPRAYCPTSGPACPGPQGRALTHGYEHQHALSHFLSCSP